MARRSEGLASPLTDQERTLEGREMTNIDVAADMHCRSCEQRVVRAVGDLDGIRSVIPDLNGQRVAVEFDKELVTESEVRAAVEGAGAHGMLDR